MAVDFIADRGVKSKSDRLRGKHIGLGVCGGIASVEVVKITRELRRHGADVKAFFTPSTSQFIGEISVEWATGHPVTTAVGAHVEHLDSFDLVLIAPATLNTITKCALGICDNAVTLLVAGQLGRKAPLIFVPTMNVSLSHHPAYATSVATLKSWGGRFLEQPVEEGRLKMPSPEETAALVLEMLA